MQLIGIILLVISSLIEFSASVSEPRVVCYYTNWSVYRPGTAKFNPQNINPYLCTHLIYAFGGFTKDNQLKPFDKYQDIEQGGYAKFTGLKTYNKELKTMLAIGGWNEGSTRFSPLVASLERRSQLVKNAIKFLRQNKFDGLDLDWEYPAFRDGGKSKDRDNYAKLVQELREEFQREHDKTGRPRLLLTMAVPAGFEYIEKGYDVPKLNKYLDWFNILSYDYHSAYEPSVNHHAPLYPIEEENEYSYDTDLNINSTINFYVKAGAEREKLVLGIPTYGRSYTLFNEESNEVGAPADGPGEQGDATREKGYLAYYEICQSLKEEDSDWTVVQPNSDALGPYAYSGNQWVGYDDEDIVRKKSKFVVEQKLGGIMFWSIDNDDFRGLCNGKPYPLIEAAKDAYLESLANGVSTKNAISKPKQSKTVTTTKRPESSKGSGKFTTPPPPTTPDPGSDFKCEDEGFYAHPRDCKKYFWCLEAAGLGIVAHQFTCPSGLYFNKAADSCDYSRNVHCSKTEVISTTTTEEPFTTTSRASSVSTRANPLYRSPSRTTTQRTTTSEYVEPITDFPELDQEDPSVIKELIDLIKKVGGVEELERQLNLQEDGASITISQENIQGPTTPSSIISKSLYDKIKNRASVLNKRPNFNGASQPERVIEKTETNEEKVSELNVTSAPSIEVVSKKYKSVNRLSRPTSQNDAIEKLDEADAVLIEKPQYTSIRRNPAIKPAVVSENDYNGDTDNSREESTTLKPQTDLQKKYASISRSRRPQVKVLEDDDESDTSATTSTTTTTEKPTSKYLNLSRRRSTTETPNTERNEVIVETTTPIRRRTTTQTAPTQKTVLNLSKTRNEIRQITQNTKDTSRYTQKDKLLENSLREEVSDEEGDEDSLLNAIALPTESVTENVPYPENILTTLPPTPPSDPLDRIQVTETLIQNDTLINGSNEIDVDTTTLSSDLHVNESGGFSKQNEINNSIEGKAPRPFSRPSLARTKEPIFYESTLIQSESTHKSIRTRPTVKFTTESNIFDNEVESTTRGQYTYRPGYRGTARFRTTSIKSGQYDRAEEDLKSSKFQPVEKNRLRSFNLDESSGPETSSIREVTRRRLTAREKTLTTISASTDEQKNSTSKRRLTTRPAFASTNTETYHEDEEVTTEQRIVEAKNYFNLAAGERPDRIRFELAVGKKIDFGAKASAKSNSESDSSKVKVLTGPLDKSPLLSGRALHRKGHVEEIPLSNLQTTEAVTIQSFSDKLNFNDIPLNKSDIERFVADEDLRTDFPTEATTRRRLRPSIKGFAQRVNDSEINSQVLETTTTERIKLRQNTQNTATSVPLSRFIKSKTRFPLRSKVETVEPKEDLTSLRTRPLAFQNRFSQKITTESTFDVDEKVSSQSQSTRLRNRLTKSDTDENVNGKSTENDNQKEDSKLSSTENRRPTVFRTTTNNKITNSEVNQKLDDSSTEESTTSPVRFRPIKGKFLQRARFDEVEIEDVNDLQTQAPFDETTLGFFNLLSNSRFAAASSNSVEDFESFSLVTALPDKVEISDSENELTTESNDENGDDENETTLNSLIDTTSTYRTVVVRKRPIKKIDVVATRQTITESNGEDTTKKTDSTDGGKMEIEKVLENFEDSTKESVEKPLAKLKATTEAPVSQAVPIRITKKRILFTRPKQSRLSETNEDIEENLNNENIKEYQKSHSETETLENGRDFENDEEKPVTVALRSRPTRKILTRVRVNNESQVSKEDSLDVSVLPRTTRKRIVFTRPKQNLPHTEEGDENVLESSSIASVEQAKTNDFTTRRKAYKTRPAIEIKQDYIDETPNVKSTSTRTRVFKRPVLDAAEPKQGVGEFELKNDNESSTPRSNSRFGSDRQRKILKIKKLINEEQEDIEVEATPSPKKRVYKVLRTKTSKSPAERFSSDGLVLEPDDESQDVNHDENNPRFESEYHKDNSEGTLEDQSAKPVLKFPTRPNSANRIVTIKRRPAFNLNSRSSTIQPTSSKFSSATKSRQVTIKRKFKPTVGSIDSTIDDIEPEKRIALGERNKKIFSKGYRKSLSTVQPPNITLTDTETTEPEDVADTTDIPHDINNENILQKDTSAKPRFSLNQKRFTTTTIRPTTLHHVFAIDVDEEENASKSKMMIKENNADEVIKKLQKLIEINRIVEIYSKEEKHKLLKNKKLKSIKQSDLTVERPPSVNKFSEISRETIIKLVKRNETLSTTQQPAVNQTRSAKSFVFAETIFSELESSTISLEGLFDREKKSNDEEIPLTETPVTETTNLNVNSTSVLRPESNETNPIIISLKSLDKVILKKVSPEKVETSVTGTSQDTTIADDN